MNKYFSLMAVSTLLMFAIIVPIVAFDCGEISHAEYDESSNLTIQSEIETGYDSNNLTFIIEDGKLLALTDDELDKYVAEILIESISNADIECTSYDYNDSEHIGIDIFYSDDSFNCNSANAAPTSNLASVSNSQTVILWSVC